MKRSGPPKRRTPLKARKGLPRKPAATAKSTAKTARARAKLPARSKKREDLRDDERDAKLALYARDGGRCLLEGRPGWGPCRGCWTPHHLRKQSKGWDWGLDNLVTLCAGHNGDVEDRPPEAHALGLVVRNGETKEEAWQRMRVAGLTT